MAELQDQISWSEEVVSPPKLAGYAKEVPALCLVVKGWTGSEGDGEWQNINEGQVVRISSIIGQRRVLAETDRGDFLSFPEEFKVKVKVKEMKGKIKWRTLHDVTQKYQLPATVFTNQNRVYSSEQARQLSLTTTSLVVIATYTERFLLGNDINGDVISKSPRMIPFYRDVQLRVGIGATSGNPNQWQALRQSYKQALGKQIYPRNNGPNVVLLFKAENIRRRMGTKTFNTLINAMNHKQQRANKTTSAKMNLPGGRHAPTFKVVINPDEPLEFCHIKDSYDTIDRDIDDKSNRDVNENVNRDVNENVESSEVEKSIMIKETTNEEEIVHEATLVYAKVEKKKVADEQPVHDKSVTISESTDDVFVELALEDDDSSSGLTNQDAPSEVHVASYEDDVNTAALNEEKRTLSESTSTLTGVHQYGTTFINGNRQDTDVGLYGEETKSPTFENRYDATNTSTMNSKSEWLNKTEDDEAPRYNTNQRLNNSVFQDIRHTKMTEEQGKRTATVIHLRETAPLSDMMVRSELDLRAEADPRSAPIRRTASTQMLTNPNPFLSVNIGSSQSINIAHLPQTQTLTQSVQVSATYPIVGNAVQEGPVLTQGRRAIENEDQPAIENTVRRAIENGNDEPVPVQEIFEKEHKQTHEKEQTKFQYTNESRDPSPRSYYSKQSPDYVQGGRSRMYVEGYGQPQPLVYPQREVFVADYPRPMVYGMPTYPQYPIMQPQPVNYVPQPTLVPVQPREVYADPYQGYPVEERVRYRGGSPNDDVQPRSRESTRRRQPREEKIKKSTKNREYASRPNRYDDDYIDLPVRRGNQSEKWEVTEDIRMADNQTPVYEEPIRRRETKRNQKSRDEWETGYSSDRKYDASLQRKQRARDDDRYDQQDFEEVKVTKTKSAVYDAEYRRSSFDDFDGMPTEGPLVNGVDLFSERDNQYEQKSSGRNDSSRYSAAKKTDSSRYSAATKSTADDRASDELFHSSRYISSPVRTTKVSNGQSAQTRSYTNDLFTRNINVTSEDFNPYAAQTSRRFTYQQSDEPRYRNRLHSRTKQYSPSSPSRPSTYRYDYNPILFSADTNTKQTKTSPSESKYRATYSSREPTESRHNLISSEWTVTAQPTLETQTSHELDKFPDFTPSPDSKVKEVPLTVSDSDSESGSSSLLSSGVRHASYDVQNRSANETLEIDHEMFNLPNETEKQQDSQSKVQVIRVSNSRSDVNTAPNSVKTQSEDAAYYKDTDSSALYDSSLSRIIASSKSEAMDELDRMTRSDNVSQRDMSTVDDTTSGYNNNSTTSQSRQTTTFYSSTSGTSSGDVYDGESSVNRSSISRTRGWVKNKSATNVSPPSSGIKSAVARANSMDSSKSSPSEVQDELKAVLSLRTTSIDEHQPPQSTTSSSRTVSTKRSSNANQVGNGSINGQVHVSETSQQSDDHQSQFSKSGRTVMTTTTRSTYSSGEKSQGKQSDLTHMGSVSSLRQVYKTPPASLSRSHQMSTTSQESSRPTSLQQLFTDPKSTSRSSQSGNFSMRFREGGSDSVVKQDLSLPAEEFHVHHNDSITMSEGPTSDYERPIAGSTADDSQSQHSYSSSKIEHFNFGLSGYQTQF